MGKSRLLERHGQSFQVSSWRLKQEPRTPNDVEAGVREIMVQYMDEADREGSPLGIRREDVTMDYAKGEYAANCLAEMLGDYNTLRKIAKSQNRNIIQKALDMAAQFHSKISGKLHKSGTQSELVGIAGIYDEAAENLESMLKKSMENAKWVGAMNAESDGSGSHHSVHEETSDSREATQKEVTAQYRDSVDSILSGTRSSKDTVLMGYTPRILTELGVPDLPVVIGPGHVYSIAKTDAEARQEGRYRKGTNYHGLGAEVVKGLYDKISNPEAVIASKDVDSKHFPVRSQRSIVEIIDIGTAGKSLLAPVEITVDRSVNGISMDVNMISSAYERNAAGLLQEAIAQENSGDIGVFYIKNEAVDMTAFRGTIPTPARHAAASGTILHQIPEKVNLRVENQTQTRQFAEWFGDWQNDPVNASKVVNEDGTPKVVYHGTNVDFNTFQSRDGAYWFSESRDYAEAMSEERKGSRIVEAYIDMKRPYRATLLPGQFSDPNYEAPIIRKAKAEGYDGVIIQNDTDSEYAADTFYVVFNPEQIKSATDNIGTFDGSNPDIRYSLNDEEDSDLPELGNGERRSKFEQFYEKDSSLLLLVRQK